MLKKLFGFVIFASCLYSVEPSIDIIKATAKRTQQYPLKKYKKVQVCAPYRTGSTLMYNICRFLFENVDVLDQAVDVQNRIVAKPKEFPNSLDDKSIFLLGTIRNPLDTCFSYYRIMTNMHKITDLHEPMIDEAVETYITNMKRLFSLAEKNKNICVLKYESFVNDFDVLFQQLEKAFDIKIHPEDQALMKVMFSKENIMLHTKRMNSFINYDPRTHIHGYHIDQEEIPTDQKKVIKKKLGEKLAPHMSLIKQWGYEL